MSTDTQLIAFNYLKSLDSFIKFEITFCSNDSNLIKKKNEKFSF